MRTIVLAAATAALFVAAEVSEASAQDAPDFSGTWTLAESSGGPGGGGPPGGRGGAGGMRAGGMVGGLGQSATITQDGSTLTIVRTGPMGETRTVYNLDGSESRNRIGGMGGNQMELVSTVAWQDDALVVVTPISFGGNTGETRMTLSLDDEGRLVVETTRSGGMGQGGTMRAVYTGG
jgi:hypothetical protein